MLWVGVGGVGGWTDLIKHTPINLYLNSPGLLICLCQPRTYTPRRVETSAGGTGSAPPCPPLPLAVHASGNLSRGFTMWQCQIIDSSKSNPFSGSRWSEKTISYAWRVLGVYLEETQWSKCPHDMCQRYEGGKGFEQSKGSRGKRLRTLPYGQNKSSSWMDEESNWYVGPPQGLDNLWRRKERRLGIKMLY